MLRRSAAFLMLVIPFCQGCVSKPLTTVDGVSAASVINLVKAELSKVETQPASQEISAADSLCSLKGKVKIVAIPISATVALKAVATGLNSGSLGLTIPISTVTLGPSLTYTNTQVNTETITYDLNIVHSPETEVDLLTDIKNLRTEIEIYSSEIADQTNGLALSIDQVAFLKKQIQTDRTKINDSEEKLIALQQQKTDISPVTTLAEPVSAAPPLQVKTEAVDSNMSIADAIRAAGQELLAVNHKALPCLKPQDVKVEIDFDVQKKADGQIGLSVLFLKFGVEHAQTNENFHSMLVTFDLTQGSTPALH